MNPVVADAEKRRVNGLAVWVGIVSILNLIGMLFVTWVMMPKLDATNRATELANEKSVQNFTLVNQNHALIQEIYDNLKAFKIDGQLKEAAAQSMKAHGDTQRLLQEILKELRKK